MGQRHAATPQSKGHNNSANNTISKFNTTVKRGSNNKRVNNMKDMVFIYADMGQSKFIKQEQLAS